MYKRADHRAPAAPSFPSNFHTAYCILHSPSVQTINPTLVLTYQSLTTHSSSQNQQTRAPWSSARPSGLRRGAARLPPAKESPV